MSKYHELARRLNQSAAQDLERTVSAMPEEKLAWKPLDAGRPALDQLAECGILDGRIAQILTDRAMPEFNREAYVKEKASLDTLDKAVAALHEGNAKLLGAIESFPEEEMEKTLPLFGKDRSFAEIMMLPYWNKVYHIGQVNYIQTLYGDHEMH